MITKDLRLLREAAQRVGFPLEQLGWNRWLQVVSYGSRPAAREGDLPLDFGRGWSVGPRDLTLTELRTSERLGSLRFLIKNRGAWWELLRYGTSKHADAPIRPPTITSDLQLLRDAARRLGYPLRDRGWRQWISVVLSAFPRPEAPELPLDCGRGWSVYARDLSEPEIRAAERMSDLRIFIKSREAWWQLYSYGMPRRTETGISIQYW